VCVRVCVCVRACVYVGVCVCVSVCAKAQVVQGSFSFLRISSENDIAVGCCLSYT